MPWQPWESYAYWDRERERLRRLRIYRTAEAILGNPILRLRLNELRQAGLSKRQQAKVLREVFGLPFIREYCV